MPSVISCSRRTDIPAFYTPWLMARLEAGYCHTLNPFGGQVYRISLKPEDVIALTFWTRNPAPMRKHLDELEARGFAFHYSVSILGYSKRFEPHSPPTDEVLRTFQSFSEHISPLRMRWRYDPIILSSETPVDYHLRQFDKLSRALEGYTQHCTFSFVQYYGKTARNMEAAAQANGITLHKPKNPEQQVLAKQLAEMANARGMSFNTCCNDLLLVEGVSKSHCVDAELIQTLVPGRADNLKAGPTRTDCGCAASVDIGMYDTCLFGCAYCYATNHLTLARQNHAAHDPNDTVLLRPAHLRDVELDQIVTPRKEK